MAGCKYAKPVIRTCALCGKRTAFTSANQKYCKPCAKEMKNARSVQVEHETYKGVHKKKKPPIVPSKTIEDIVRIASANGISYGKAVRLLEGR